MKNLKHIKLFEQYKVNESNEEAGKIMNAIFTTARALKFHKMDMKNPDADSKLYATEWGKTGFPPNTEGIIGIQNIENGMAASIFLMSDKEKIEKILDVIDTNNKSFKFDKDFQMKQRIYDIDNSSKDKKTFGLMFNLDFSLPKK
jgi:hypothetical protein